MNFLKRLFKKENNNVTELYLSLLDYNIIPPSNDFYNTEDNLILSSEYNNKYREILSNRCKSSIDLKLDDVDLNMYVNIISKLTIELHNISDILNQIEDRNNINLNIIINKLNYYKSVLSEYKDKSFIKIKVLDNILKRKILFHNKRSIIESEISNIKGKILICQNNISGIEKELNYYYSFSSNNIPKVDNKKEYLSSIYNRDYRFTKALKLNIEYKKDISLSDICSIEILLENYLYNNKDLLSKIKEEYNTLLNSNIDRNKKLRIINNLINKYMAIDKLYKEKDTIFLNKLLELKFNTIEEDYISNGEKLINRYSYKEEIEYFGNIISNRIDNIVRDKDKRILSRYQEYFKEYGFIINDYERLIRIFKDIITTRKTPKIFYAKYQNEKEHLIDSKKDGTFNIKEIISNPLYIGLILSMDSPEKLINYINNFKIDINDCSRIYFYNEIFEWENEVPLETIIRLMYENYGTTDNKKYAYEKATMSKEMYNIFILHYLLMGEYSNGIRHKNELSLESINDFYQNNKKYQYTLYEGISEVKDTNYFKDFSFLKECEEIHFPTTVKKINVNPFLRKYPYLCSIWIDSNITELIMEKLISITFFNSYKIDAIYDKEGFKKLFRGILPNENILNYEDYFNYKAIYFTDVKSHQPCSTIRIRNYDIRKYIPYTLIKYETEKVLDIMYDIFKEKLGINESFKLTK